MQVLPELGHLELKSVDAQSRQVTHRCQCDPGYTADTQVLNRMEETSYVGVEDLT